MVPLREVVCRAAALAIVLAMAGSAYGTDIPLDQRRSGYADLSRDSKAMQDDDTINPATLWVLDGEALWSQKTGAVNRACADCHQDATVSMKGVAAAHRLSDLPAGMAKPRLTATAVAQLHDRAARGSLRLWRARECEP
jgi:hypothetical protein